MQTHKFTLHHLLHAADLVQDRLRRRLEALDLWPRQARILDALARMGEASQIDLAREFHVTPGSMSTMTVRLITAGLVSREVDPEQARSNVLRLTPQGHALITEIHTAWHDIDRLIIEQIGPAKAAALSALTRELRDELGGHIPGASSGAPAFPTTETSS